MGEHKHGGIIPGTVYSNLDILLGFPCQSSTLSPEFATPVNFTKGAPRMKKWVAMAVVFILTSFFANQGFGQTTEELKSLREEIKALKEGQAAIQKDLQEIKNLLTRPAQPQGPPPFKEAVVSIDAGHVKGRREATLVMIDFSEYQ
jgi:hypothetical protein